MIGTVTAIFAMISGLYELGRIKRSDQAGLVVDMHIQLMLVAWMLYGASLLMRMLGLQLAGPGVVEILLSAVGLAVLLTAGWYGGKLVYEHGVGVKNQQEESS